MSADIISIETKAAPADRDADVIALLESLLDDARFGRIEGVAIAAVSKDGFIRCSWRGSTKATAMLGTIERLKYDMLLAIAEDER